MILSRAITAAKRALDPAKATMSGEVMINRDALQEILDAIRPIFPLCKIPKKFVNGKVVEKFCSLGIPNYLGEVHCSKSPSKERCPGFYKCKAKYRPQSLWTMTVYRY
jgi:hypothetical protein